jgi:hypothetical protein
VGLEPVAADPGVTTGAEHWPVLRPRRAG